MHHFFKTPPIKKRLNRYQFGLFSSGSLLLTGCVDIDPHYHHYGTVGDDIMTESRGAERIVFHSSLGADKVTSKQGAEMDYSQSNTGVIAYLDGTVGTSGHAEGDVLKGINTLVGSKFDDQLYSTTNYTGGTPHLYGKDGNDQLYGTDGSEVLYGGNGNDNLFGNAGNDYLIGGAGADILDGGEGIDEANYYQTGLYIHENASPKSININLLLGTASGGYADGDTLISIENITGTKFDDILTGDDGANTISGQGGADKIFGMGGNDILYGYGDKLIIDGGSGDDKIDFNGTESNIFGGDGNDIISKNYQNDEHKNNIDGGDGSDLLQVKKHRKEENQSSGDDKLTVAKVSFSIQKNDGIISSKQDGEILHLKSIEKIEFLPKHYTPTPHDFIDVKEIWTKLDSDDQALFNNLETEFISWLGDDMGYNYEGL